MAQTHMYIRMYVCTYASQRYLQRLQFQFSRAKTEKEKKKLSCGNAVATKKKLIALPG